MNWFLELNPLKISCLIKSVKKTRSLLVIDGGWKTCGLASEIISSVLEEISPGTLKNSPINISLKGCPAPTSSILESQYYTTVEEIVKNIREKVF